VTSLLGLAERPSDGADPRRTQKRVAVSPSGRTVLVDITGDDRLRMLKQFLPGRWADVMIARERGESLDQIARWAKCPPPCNPCHFKRVLDIPSDPNGPSTEVHVGDPCLTFYVARIYTWFETALHDLADRRAKLLP
jgi:hypothetical protein